MRKRGRKPIFNKVRDSEDWCFVCKDGGDVVICDYRNCIKSYHPDCIGKDDSIKDSTESWTCNWHFCCKCKRSAYFQCICCPIAVCPKCTNIAEFVVVKQKSGFCPECLDLVWMIEENKDVDSDGKKIDFKDLSSCEGLFMDYYTTEIKEQNHITIEDVRAAKDKAMKGEFDVEEFLIGEENDSGSDYEVEREVKEDEEPKHKRGFKVQPPAKRAKVKIDFEVQQPAMKVKIFKPKDLQFNEWGSTRLLSFLESIHVDITREKYHHQVEKLIKSYVKNNNLSDPRKKTSKLIFCDANLQRFFDMPVINRGDIGALLKPHFANDFSSSSSSEDEEEVEEDKGEEEEEKIVTSLGNKVASVASKSRRRPKKEMVSRAPKSIFAAIVAENIKLVYLRKTFLQELSKDTEAFQEKVTGCFVRVKSDPRKFDFELLQVTGSEKSTSGDSSGEMVLFVTTKPTAIRLSSLSDMDIEIEECVELAQKVKDGLIPKPTIADVEMKAKILHVDITKHWIARELKFLDMRINKAKEKGQRQLFLECMDKRKLLQNPLEQTRLLEKTPTVKPEELETVSREGS